MAENFKTFAIALDIKVASYAKIPVVEGDTGNRFVITLTDDGTAVDLSTSRVVAVFSGSMGTRSQDSWTSTDGSLVISGASHNIVTLDLLNGSFANGLNTCELQVYSGATYTRLVTSASFTFNARKPILNDTTIASTTEYPILVSLIDQVETLIDLAQADWTEADNTKRTYIQHKPVVNVDFAAAAHASRHLIGGADALNAMPYDATSTNLLINGGFYVWQRGTSQTVIGYGSDDKWGNSFSNSTKTHSRQTFTVGQTDVPGNPIYYSRSVVTTSNAANALNVKYQNIEDVTRFSGKQVTVSFWAKADAAKNIAIEFLQQFGTGGSTSVNGIGSQKIALTTSWAKYTATVDIPSIAGKTVGTSSAFQLRFWFEAGSDYNARTDTLGNQSGTFDIANVQLNYGSVALPFVSNGYTELLAQASRYVVIPTVATIYGRMVSYTANTITFFVPTMAPMSRNPSIRGMINTDYIVYNNAGVAQNGFTSGSATAVANGVIVVMTKTSHGLTDGSIGLISPNGGFDADL